ncbi:serine protease [bacterium]|nr:MAG: serine protease [bacterium]
MILLLALLMAGCAAVAFALGIAAVGRWRFGRYVQVHVGLFVVAMAATLGLLWPLTGQRFVWPYILALALMYGVWRNRGYLHSAVQEEDSKGEDRAVAADASILPLACAVRVVSGTGDGSGFIASSDGYVATVAHGIPRFGKFDVILFNGERWPAVVVAVEDAVDLAILKIDVPYVLPAARLDDGEDLGHGDRLSIIGFDPVSDIADATIWTPQGYRDLRMPYPSVLGTALANAGFDDRSEDLPRLDAFVTDPNRAVRPGFSGAMVCNANGQVVAVHNSGLSFGGYGGDIAGSMLITLLAEAKIQTKRSPFWRMPLDQKSAEHTRGRATYSFAAFFSRFSDDAEISPDDLNRWREFLEPMKEVLDPIAEYQSVKAALDVQQDRKDEAERAAFAAIEGGSMRFARHVLTVIAREHPERALEYADRFANLRSKLEGEARYGPISYRRSMLSITEAELREIGGDIPAAAALLEATMPDQEANRSAGTAWFRLGKLRLALDKPEEAVEAFRLGVGDNDLYEEDWSPLIEACSRSSKPDDQAYGVKLALWALDHSATVKTMPPHAAACAEKRGEPELAAWFASLGRALNPPQDEIEVPLPVNSEVPPAPVGDHYAQSRYRRTPERR